MTKTKSNRKLIPFDAARYLKDDEAIAEYLTAVLETDDPDLLLLAIGDVARAKGIAEVAKQSGLGRESLYKALNPWRQTAFRHPPKGHPPLGVKFTPQLT